MAGKKLPQPVKYYNILPYYVIFFALYFLQFVSSLISLSKDKYPRTNIVVHYKYYYNYPTAIAIGKKLQTMNENLKH